MTSEVRALSASSTRDDRQPHERRMCFVVQNSLPNHDVASVSFVIPTGIQIAVVFREGRGGDDDAQTMPGEKLETGVRPAICDSKEEMNRGQAFDFSILTGELAVTPSFSTENRRIEESKA
jgi:hypothetical protein